MTTNDKYLPVQAVVDMIYALNTAVQLEAKRNPEGRIRANNAFDLLLNTIECHPNIQVQRWTRDEIKRIEGVK